jgi:hypothetical protein
MFRFLSLSLFLLLLIGCASANGTPATAVSNSSNQADAETLPAEGTAVYDIYSDSGIGSEIFLRPGKQWPTQVILRFHLKGLEEMILSYGATAVTLNIPSHGQNEMQQSVTRNGQSETGRSDSYQLTVTIVNADGSEGTIPLEDGTINVTLPPDFHQENPESFNVSWIDFYR